MHAINHECVCMYLNIMFLSFIHFRIVSFIVATYPIQYSFLHIEHLYSASSRKLLRSAPNTSTVKQSSLNLLTGRDEYTRPKSGLFHINSPLRGLRWEKNPGKMVLLKMRSSEGRPFHVEGPTMEMARNCLAEIRAKGTRRRCWDEQSDIYPRIKFYNTKARKTERVLGWCWYAEAPPVVYYLSGPY